MHLQKKIVLILVSMFLPLSEWAQNIERKIIIDKDQCYFTTIDPEFQIATLHVVAIDKPLKTAKEYAIPAGRSLSTPVIPFSWDLSGQNLFAINFMNNALNNRRNAIKCIPLHSLIVWNDKLSISDVVMKSTEVMPYTRFEPYAYVTEKSNLLDHFFFDCIATSDSSLCLAISNNGELSIWEFRNNSWTKGEELKMVNDNFFSLFNDQHQTYLITSSGAVHAVQNNRLKKQPETSLNNSLADGILIIDKVNRRILFLENAKLNRQKSVAEIVKDAILISL